MVWIAPAALLGLVAVAIPILVHLFARRPGVRVAFPTLRFLRPATVHARAFRPTDLVLLSLRVGIVASAVVALAQPIVITKAREAQWKTRTARAIIVEVAPSAAAGTGSGDAPLPSGVADGVRTAAFSRTFRTAHLRLGVAEAANWLARVPPARREMVIVSTFGAGSLDAESFAAVDPRIGIRFEPVVTAAPVQAVGQPAFRVRAGVVSRFTPQGRFTPDGTAVSVGSLKDAPASSTTPDGCAPAVEISGEQDGAGVADAATRAVLALGVPCPIDASRRLRLTFTGKPTGRRPDSTLAPWMLDALAFLATQPGQSTLLLEFASNEGGSLVIPADGSPATAEGLAAIRSAFESLGDPLRIRSMDPTLIPSATLASWSRPAGEPDRDAIVHDTVRDGRWLWGLTLALLLIETMVRRLRRSAPASMEAAA